MPWMSSAYLNRSAERSAAHKREMQKRQGALDALIERTARAHGWSLNTEEGTHE